MSTVPEAIAAADCGMTILAVSVVTNVARPDIRSIVQPQEVVRAAASAQARVRDLVLEFAVAAGESK
jgi:purine nucleoside phosphorylase